MAKEDKIQQILLCAKELFGRYGYDKVSMRDIADRVGISVGNLTYYYGRKERIMLAVLDQINEEIACPAEIPATLAEVDAALQRFSRIAAQSNCLFRRYNLNDRLGEEMLRCQKNLVQASRDFWAGDTARTGTEQPAEPGAVQRPLQRAGHGDPDGVPVLGQLCGAGGEYRQSVSPVPAVRLEFAVPQPHRGGTGAVLRADSAWIFRPCRCLTRF